MRTLSTFRRLLVLGLLIEAAYVCFLVRPFPLLKYYATPLLDLGKLTDYRPWQAVALAMGLVFLLYILAYRTDGDPRLGRLVLGFGVVFAVTQILVYPIGALDVFDYIFFGHRMAQFGANPYLVVPMDFSSDPFYEFIGWKGLSFTYGPAWALLSKSLGWLGRDSLLANLILFKVVAVAAYAASGTLIYRLLLREAPQRALRGTLFFAWNPLVVFEAASNAHNDIFVVLLLVLSVDAFAYRWRARGMSFLWLSILTKFVTAPLAPLWVAAGLRSERHRKPRLLFLLGALIVALALGVLCYVPFRGDRSNMKAVLLAPIQRQELFTSSFPTLFVLKATNKLGKEQAEKLARNGAMLLLLLYTLYQMWRVKGDWQDLVRASYNVVLFYLLFLCLWFQPWYVMWLAPLAALLPPGRQARTVIVFCVSAMTKYLVFDFFWFSVPWLVETLHVEAAAVAGIYALPLLYLAISLFGSVWRRRRTATSAILRQEQ